MDENTRNNEAQSQKASERVSEINTGNAMREAPKKSISGAVLYSVTGLFILGILGLVVWGVITLIGMI